MLVKLILLLCFSMESSHFGRQFGTLQNVFLGLSIQAPYNPQNLLPKICTKSPISRLVWHIDRRCLGLIGCLRGWPIQRNHAKCCGADPWCHGNKIWAKIAYNSAYVTHRPQMFGFRGRPTQWNHTKCCGPTLVAMATTFRLGAEFSRLPACHTPLRYVY